LDVPDELDAALHGVRLVVSCVERPNDTLTRAALKRGIGYVEVGASLDALQRALALNEIAIRTNTLAIASVGLVPGLSNLLAADLTRRLDGRAEQVNVFIMLGLGDTHGVDATRWLLERMDDPFTVPTPDGLQCVHPLSDPVAVRFLGEQRSRVTYRFDFADQHVLPKTVGTAGASTRICFDSRLVTRLFGAVRRLGLTRIASKLPPAVVARALDWLPFGSDGYALLVVAQGRDGTVLRSGVTGQEEARATGVLTAAAAEALLADRVPAGVHHVEGVLRLGEVRDRAEHAGIHFWLPEGDQPST
jgi:saccharopine dehydrogenase-like NADP-dependent oxidoreductase